MNKALVDATPSEICALIKIVVAILRFQLPHLLSVFV